MYIGGIIFLNSYLLILKNKFLILYILNFEEKLSTSLPFIQNPVQNNERMNLFSYFLFAQLYYLQARNV